MAMVPRIRRVSGTSLVISGMGVTFFVAYLIYITFNVSYLQGPEWLFLLGLLLVGALSLGLIYGGYWVRRSEFTVENGWRVTIWTFAGLIAALALTFWPIFYQRIVGVRIEDPIFILLVSSGLGANAGVVAGVYQIRSEKQYHEAQQAQEFLEFLNRLLRHNVLNAVTIIRGTANQLTTPEHSEETVEQARVIRTQSDQISDLIQNTKVLIQQFEGNVDSEPVDIVSITRDVLETARKTHEEADIVSELDSTGEIPVRADPLLSAVIENLVTNAIIHNDQDTPQLSATLDTQNGSAVLRISDNGPGLPEETPEELIDPGFHGDKGLGLHLVDTFVAQYGGDLHFADHDPTGTVVTIEIPLADGNSPEVN